MLGIRNRDRSRRLGGGCMLLTLGNADVLRNLDSVFYGAFTLLNASPQRYFQLLRHVFHRATQTFKAPLNLTKLSFHVSGNVELRRCLPDPNQQLVTNDLATSYRSLHRRWTNVEDRRVAFERNIRHNLDRMLTDLFLLRRPLVRLQCWDIEHEALFEFDYELFVERLLVGQSFISLLELFLLVLDEIIDVWSGKKKVFWQSPQRKSPPVSVFHYFNQRSGLWCQIKRWRQAPRFLPNRV